ncbi:hypothetical protein J6590_047464 [Homalodisca vitripennis]|nr:hypothetical protein J6590_047464 [Homalodisca vitripennis]
MGCCRPGSYLSYMDFGWSYRYDDQRSYFGDDSVMDIPLPLKYSWPGLSLGKCRRYTNEFEMNVVVPLSTVE